MGCGGVVVVCARVPGLGADAYRLRTLGTIDGVIPVIG